MAESLSAGWIAVGDEIGAGSGMLTGFLLENGMLGGSIDAGKWEQSLSAGATVEVEDTVVYFRQIVRFALPQPEFSQTLLYVVARYEMRRLRLLLERTWSDW